MREETPVVYLLAGPDGPAKAAYARILMDHGVLEVPAGAPAQLAAALADHVRAGRDTFLDHEHVPLAERDHYKSLVEEHGGEWCLITFSLDHTALATHLED